MSAEFKRTIHTPIGSLMLLADEGGICALKFAAQREERGEHPFLLQAEDELNEYFAGRRRRFSVPLSINGTDFQKKVWRALAEIPYGKTAGYQEIAAAIGNPKACRAVGMANHVNPVPILVPCHRVVGKNGKLTGYAGGLEIKEFLLNLERKHAEV